ncbi:erythroferrone [Artibeus jamaicensis]|uniref:erythroferrone n=1 Tax=Artibeus jamaicensis TaxID=9417 RepID=UPI00235B0624|nr:erythroferrone [Artibeus jamaicensis]
MGSISHQGMCRKATNDCIRKRCPKARGRGRPVFSEKRKWTRRRVQRREEGLPETGVLDSAQRTRSRRGAERRSTGGGVQAATRECSRLLRPASPPLPREPRSPSGHPALPGAPPAALSLTRPRCSARPSREGAPGAPPAERGGGFKRVIRRGVRERRIPRRRAQSREGPAAHMASAGARLLLVCACLLAAAAALGSRDPGAPAGSRAGQEPMPKKEPPAGARESRARLDTSPPEPTTQPAPSLNPRDTWLWFLRHSDKEDRVKDRKSKPGLPRSREPCGIQGPTGTAVPVEGRQKWQQLLKAAAEMLRQDAERRPAAEDEEEEAGEPSVVALLTQASNRGSRARMVEAAFHCRLRQNVSVERRALQELGGYYLPQAEGAFYRGLGLNLTSGQYTVSVPGFYALAATLHVALPEPRPRNRLRLLICIQSQCQRNTSLETVVSRPTGTELFTISVSGVLYLKRRQYTSVFLDNAGSSPVTVRSGSHFSAIFLGV